MKEFEISVEASQNLPEFEAAMFMKPSELQHGPNDNCKKLLVLVRFFLLVTFAILVLCIYPEDESVTQQSTAMGLSIIFWLCAFFDLTA